MVKLKAQNFVMHKTNDAEELCLQNCIPNLTNKIRDSEQQCMESCLKKLISGLDHLTRVEKLGGFDGQ